MFCDCIIVVEEIAACWTKAMITPLEELLKSVDQVKQSSVQVT